MEKDINGADQGLALGKLSQGPFMERLLRPVFALLYVFNPFDLLPDVLPIIGAVDDAAVVGACLLLIERDLRQYRSWKENQLMLNEPKG